METHLEISPRGWFLTNVVESPSADDLKACCCNVVKSPVQVFIRDHLHPICIRAVKAEKTVKRSVPGHIWKVTDSPAVEVKLSVLDCDKIVRPPLQLCATCNKELESDHQKQNCVHSHVDGMRGGLSKYGGRHFYPKTVGSFYTRGWTRPTSETSNNKHSAELRSFASWDWSFFYNQHSQSVTTTSANVCVGLT